MGWGEARGVSLAEKLKELGLSFWGSDCETCGNTTPGSMVCDQCGLRTDTFALFCLNRRDVYVS